ncbi:MAG: GntR family transcriptional regulator [Sedimentibacter sp.]
MIVKNSLVEQVCSYIIEGIQSREFKPGDRLIIEDLSKKLGISRTPIREAIGNLAQFGYVDIQHNVGPRIVNYSKSQIHDLNETNEILFNSVLKKVLEKTDVEPLVLELKRIVNMQENALIKNDDERYRKSSVEFHEALIKACPNEKLRQITLQTQNQINIFILWYFQDKKIKKTSVQEHKYLLSLIENKKYDEFIVEFERHNNKAIEYFDNKYEEIVL